VPHTARIALLCHPEIRRVENYFASMDLAAQALSVKPVRAFQRSKGLYQTSKTMTLDGLLMAA
jgi:hypothetical protein